MKTIIGLNDPKAVKHYSGRLFVDSARNSYWVGRMSGRGQNAMTPIQILTELEREAGEQITYDLVMQLKMKPVYGDDRLRDQEERLNFFTDQIYIDQVRGGVNTGGRMTRKRTLHNLRQIARTRQSEWWGRLYDEYCFMYMSGARGINPDYIEDVDFTGFANNSLTAPDSEHIMFGGAATAKANLTSSHKLDLRLLDRLKAKADTMGGGSEGIPQIQPIMIDGERKWVYVMHPWNEYDLRANTSSGQYLDIQKAAAGAEGRRNPIFTGALGQHNSIILHCHRGIIRFDDYGSGGDVKAARNLFLGSQAAVMAFGSPGSGLRVDWHEETEDRGNEVVITTRCIMGVKKTTFNDMDFGLFAADVATAEPVGA